MSRPKRNFALDRDPITALQATDETEDTDDEEAENEGQEIDGPAKPRKVSANDDALPPWWQTFWKPAIPLKRNSAGQRRWYFRKRIYREVSLEETSQTEATLLLDLDRRSAA